MANSTIQLGMTNDQITTLIDNKISATRAPGPVLNLNGTLIVGMGKLKIQTILCIIGMLLHIPVSLVLSNSFGAYGVLISLTFITLIYAIVVNIQVNKILNKTAVGIWIE